MAAPTEEEVRLNLIEFQENFDVFVQLVSKAVPLRVYGRRQKEWQSELASVLAVSGCVVGLVPRDRLSRDRRGDNYPTDDLAVLMTKRVDICMCFENLLKFSERKGGFGRNIGTS